MKKKALETQFVLFIENSGCGDLEKRKFYQILPDEVVDEFQEATCNSESDFIHLSQGHLIVPIHFIYMNFFACRSELCSRFFPKNVHLCKAKPRSKSYN